MENGRTGTRVEEMTLESFSYRTGRHMTPFFAGRRELIDIALRRRDEVLENVNAGFKNPAEGVTLLFQGAPGAGKTSLLTKIRQDLGIPCVELEVKDLSDPETVLEKARLALTMSRVPDGGKRVAETFEDLSIRLIGMDASKILKAFGKAVRGTIAVLIDEVQNLDRGNRQAVDCLRTLHEGKHGVPVLPILAGLGNSPDILARAGISRLDPPKGISVGLLTPEEAKESVGSFMEYFKVKGDTGAWVEDVVRRSDLWPQHLHDGLRALAAELAKTDADIDRIDGERVKSLESGYRTDSYHGRLQSSEVRNAISLVAELVDGIPERGMMRASVRKAILLKTRPSDDPDGEGYRVPDDTDGFLDHLIHKGILQEDGDMTYHCPIPSLRTFLKKAFLPEPRGWRI